MTLSRPKKILILFACAAVAILILGWFFRNDGVDAPLVVIPTDERETGIVEENPAASFEQSGEAHYLSQITLRGKQINNICTLTYGEHGCITQVTSDRSGSPYVQRYAYREDGSLETMTEEYDEVLITYHYNNPTYEVQENGEGLYIQSWTTEGSPSGALGGRSVYVTQDQGSRCKSLVTTIYYSGDKQSVSTYEYDDQGRLERYVYENADGSSNEERFSYTGEGDGDLMVEAGDSELRWTLTCNTEGRPTSLENRKTGVALLLVYDELVAQPSDFSRLQNQINLSQFLTMAVGAAISSEGDESVW